MALVTMFSFTGPRCSGTGMEEPRVVIVCDTHKRLPLIRCVEPSGRGYRLTLMRVRWRRTGRSVSRSGPSKPKLLRVLSPNKSTISCETNSSLPLLLEGVIVLNALSDSQTSRQRSCCCNLLICDMVKPQGHKA